MKNLRHFDSLTRAAAAYAPLLLRLTLGSLFIAHLYWKFAVYPGGLERWWSNFSANGYPWFVPWYVMSAELPVLWGVLLVLQFLLGSGPYALKRRNGVSADKSLERMRGG